MVKRITWKLSQKQKKNILIKPRKLLVEGSAGSGKTIFAVHKTIKYALEHSKARIGVFRDTLTSLKVTSLLEVREALEDYGIPFKENKTEHTITFPNGAVIFFRGLDDLKKIRSLNLDFIWIEQAEEIEWETYVEVEKRLRGKVSKKYGDGQLILTVTPELKTHWIYNYFHRLHKGFILHFHYTDNPFLPYEYVQEYEELKEIDYELWVKYTLGKWGTISNLVYEKWDQKVLTMEPKFWTGGVDFGYNAPSAFLLIGWHDEEPYIHREVYKRHLTNDEFIKKIKECLQEVEISDRTISLRPEDLDKVYCEAAEPDRIEEFCQAGFDAVGGTKKFTERIDKVKTVTVHISPECVNTKKEIRSYKFRKDKDGNVEDKPIPKFDHAMDAMGYSVYGILGPVTEEQGELIPGFG